MAGRRRTSILGTDNDNADANSGTSERIGNSDSGTATDDSVNGRTDIDVDPTAIERDGGNTGEPITRLNKDGTPRKRRGRKAGSAKTSNLDVSGLESLLYAVHMGLASVAKVPELRLEQEEAKTLAEASSNVLRHYDIGATQKAFDWAHLAIAIGTVYGSRIIAIQFRRKAEKEEAETPRPVRNLMEVGRA